MSLIVGRTYTRSKIATELNVPEEKRLGGDFTTGYCQPWKKSEDNRTALIFANVGSSDPLGFNYPNVWEDNGDLSWTGKTKSSLSDVVIQDMLADESSVHIFTRSDEKAPWLYNGLATPVDYQDETPVIIRWSLNNEEATRARLKSGVGKQEPADADRFLLLYVASAVSLADKQELPVRKVGIAKNRLDPRIKSLNSTKMPIQVDRVTHYSFEYSDLDARGVESEIHELLKAHKVNGEWFSNEEVDIESLVNCVCRDRGAIEKGVEKRLT